MPILLSGRIRSKPFTDIQPQVPADGPFPRMLRYPCLKYPIFGCVLEAVPVGAGADFTFYKKVRPMRQKCPFPLKIEGKGRPVPLHPLLWRIETGLGY